MKRIFGVMALLWPLLSLCQGSFQPLAIGDKVPEVLMRPVTNYAALTLRLSGLKDKLVIIDFWATWCGACIGAFAKLDSLQQQYNGRVVILAVTSEPSNKIRTFLARFPKANKKGLIYIAGDKQLNVHFPHKLIPHEVWIDPQGKVYATTEAKLVTPETIEACLAGLPYSGIDKKDITGINKSIPLLANPNNAVQSGLLIQSALFGHLGLAGGISKGNDSSGRQWRRFINFTLTGMLSNISSFPNFNRRLVIETADSSRYLPPTTNAAQWTLAHSYCYELIMPENITDEEIKQYQLSDLQRYFSINTRIEKRWKSCMVLRAADSAAAMPPLNYGASRILVPALAGDSLIIENSPVSELVKWLNMLPRTAGLPLYIDETGISNNISIRLPSRSLEDSVLLRRELARFGLTLIDEQKEIDCFIISDKKRTTAPYNSTITLSTSPFKK